MTVLHTVLHATAFVRSDPRRDARQLWPTTTAHAEDAEDAEDVEESGGSCRKYGGSPVAE